MAELLLIMLLAAQAVAQTPADSLHTQAPKALARPPADSLQTQAPRKALVRSLLLPGWGQYANGRPFKALGFGAAAAVLAGRVVAQQHSLSRATGRGASDLELQDLAAGRNTRVLLFVANATLAGIDAYVDAQLAGFELSVGPRAGPGGVLLEFRVSGNRFSNW